MNTPVSFELAKLLKQKEYNVPTNSYYEHALIDMHNDGDGYHGPFGWRKGETNLQSGYHVNNSKYDNSNDCWLMCAAPTIAEVVMWLYEKHGVWIECTVNNNIQVKSKYVTFDSRIVHKNRNVKFRVITNTQVNKYTEPFNSPTEAYEAAIEYTLKNLTP